MPPHSQVLEDTPAIDRCAHNISKLFDSPGSAGIELRLPAGTASPDSFLAVAHALAAKEETLSQRLAKVPFGRPRALEQEMAKYGLHVRSDSKVAEMFIEYGMGPNGEDLHETVEVAREMNFLFTKTRYAAVFWWARAAQQ